MQKYLYLLILFSLLSSNLFADAISLSHSRGEVDKWTHRLVIEAKLPVFGQRSLSADYTTHRTVHDNGRVEAKIEVGQTPNPYYSVPIGPFCATFNVTNQGVTGPMVSSALEDDYQSTFVKDAFFLFPPLPQGTVKPGDQWHWQSEIALPATQHLGAMGSLVRSLEVNGTSTYKGLDENGNAQIAVVINERPIKGIRLKMEGDLYFCPRGGHLTYGTLSGKMAVKKLFWFKAPVTFRFALVEENETEELSIDEGLNMVQSNHDVR